MSDTPPKTCSAICKQNCCSFLPECRHKTSIMEFPCSTLVLMRRGIQHLSYSFQAMVAEASIGTATVSFEMSCESHLVDLVVLSFCIFHCPLVRKIYPSMSMWEMTPLVSRSSNPFFWPVGNASADWRQFVTIALKMCPASAAHLFKRNKEKISLCALFFSEAVLNTNWFVFPWFTNVGSRCKTDLSEVD